MHRSMTSASTSELPHTSAQCQKSSTVTERPGYRSHNTMPGSLAIASCSVVFKTVHTFHVVLLVGYCYVFYSCG